MEGKIDWDAVRSETGSCGLEGVEGLDQSSGGGKKGRDCVSGTGTEENVEARRMLGDWEPKEILEDC